MTPPEQTPLAIVGMACRLPGADSTDEYWRLISEGRCAIGELPPERFDRELYFQLQKGVRGKSYSSLGALSSWPTCACLPSDVIQSSDPAHLTFCQVAVEAFHSAGFDSSSKTHCRTGVYVGHTSGTPWGGHICHATMIEITATWLREIEGFQNLAKGKAEDIVAGIVSDVRASIPHRVGEVTPFLSANQIALLVARALNLNGPAIAINAACASSMIALSVAARALDQNQIDTAIIGGTSYFKPDGLILFSKAQSVSATGSRPFDEAADGLVVGEGCAALVVRRLDAAMADGNPICAIIRGVGISSDGRGKSLWAPRKEGQMEAMQRAYGSNMDLQRLGYVEAHATSTAVGDATELAALGEVLQERRHRKIPIGSVKANIGHTLETAGVAGLLKVVLALQHKQIPPAINVVQPNTEFNWRDSPLYVPNELQYWPAPCDPMTGRELPRQAAVNSFGIGGLNAHVILDEFVGSEKKPTNTSFNCGQSVEEGIAVIGAGAIFPGAPNLDAFEKLFCEGHNPRNDVPRQRWNSDLVFKPGKPELWRTITKRGGFVTDYQYDWRKHRVPPKQVTNADPLQFMLLDAVDQAIVDAGYGEKPFARQRTGVVVGNAFGGDFAVQLQMGLRIPVFRKLLIQRLRPLTADSEAIDRIAEQYEELLLQRMTALLDETGSYSTSTLASRITKTFNLMGGAYAVDGGIGSTLAALMACTDSLRGHHCDMMICAAGQRSMDLIAYQRLSRSGILCNDDGTIREEMLPAEGVGVLVLKRLADAERDGDRIRGVITAIEMSSDQDLRAAISSMMNFRSSTEIETEVIAKLETNLRTAPFEYPGVNSALVELFGEKHQDGLPGNHVARQIGNAEGASGMASLLKLILDLKTHPKPTLAAFISVQSAPKGRLHQAGCVFVRNQCKNASVSLTQVSSIGTEGRPGQSSDSAFEIGRQCGQEDALSIHRVLRRHADLAGWPKGSPQIFEDWAIHFDAWFDDCQLQEMRGIARGTNVAFESIVAHNLRLAAEISGGGCVHLTLPKTYIGMLHAANEDLPFSLTMKDCLHRRLQHRSAQAKKSYVTFGVVGQICGINGMNQAGISVSSAMLLNRSIPRQPAKLHCTLVQRLLEHATDITSAIDIIKEFAPTAASSWGVWLSHGPTKRVCYVEYDRDGSVSKRDEELEHCAANHSLLLAAMKEPMSHSLVRLQRMRQLVSDCKQSDDPIGTIQSALRDRFDGARQRITPHPTMNTIRRVDNQISLVMRPDIGTILYTTGPLSENEHLFHTFKFDGFGKPGLASVSMANALEPDRSVEQICNRYSLRMKASPLTAIQPSSFNLNSTAWILGDNPTSNSLAHKIEADGNRAICLSTDCDVENLLKNIQKFWHDNPAGHLFLMTSFDSPVQSSLSEATWRHRRSQQVMLPYLVTQRWLSLVQSAGILDSASVVACTLLGGDFGLASDTVQVESGALTGLVKALNVEFGNRKQNGFRTKVIDVASSHSPDQVTNFIADELAANDEAVEVGYNASNQRHLLKTVAQSLPKYSTARSNLIPRGNWIVTGGGRGVTAAVALQIGKRFGLTLHLIGASPFPKIDPDWRNLSEAQLRSLRTEICHDAARRGEKPIVAWSRIEKAIEIDANLRLLHDAGVNATYHVCDVSNRLSLAATLKHIRSTAGLIEGVIHGAGFERSCRFDKKKREDVERTLAAKVDGAAALMELTATDPLQAFLAFGSVSGRWGAMGQTDYCMANDMIAKLIDWYRTWRTDCPATVFHWPAWGEVGMAVRPETQGLLERFNVRFMPTAEGCEFLINELCNGLPEREILIADSQSQILDAARSDAFEPARTRLPLLDEILESNCPNQSLAVCHLNPKRDPFLIQHQLRRKPILPIVIAIEAMLQAASRSTSPQKRVTALCDIEAIAGLHFHSDRIQHATIRVTEQGEGAQCELRCDFHNRAGRLMRENILHVQGRVEYSTIPFVQNKPLTDLPKAWAMVEYPAEREEALYHGPIFRNADWIHYHERVGWTRLIAPSLTELAGHRGTDGWLTSPGLLDSALFSCGIFLWLHREKSIGIPHRIHALRLGRAVRPGEICYQRFEFVGMRDGHAFFDFEVIAENGDIVLSVEKYQTIDVQSGEVPN